MKVAYIEIGNRSFSLVPDEVEEVMAAAVTARATGEWLEFNDAAGRPLRMLLPLEALLVLHEYEIDEQEHPDIDPNDWGSFDFDF